MVRLSAGAFANVLVPVPEFHRLSGRERGGTSISPSHDWRSPSLFPALGNLHRFHLSLRWASPRCVPPSCSRLRQRVRARPFPLELVCLHRLEVCATLRVPNSPAALPDPT